MIRRHFLQSILALGVAPAIVRADSLMRIVPRGTAILLQTPVAFDQAAAWEVAQLEYTFTLANDGVYQLLQLNDVFTVKGMQAVVRSIEYTDDGKMHVAATETRPGSSLLLVPDKDLMQPPRLLKRHTSALERA